MDLFAPHGAIKSTLWPAGEKSYLQNYILVKIKSGNYVQHVKKCETGLGAVLTQTISGHNNEIAYASKGLTEKKRKYSTREKECLAVIWVIKKFRAYLEGYELKVITDHVVLTRLHNIKNGIGRWTRWASELLECNYAIEYRKGSNNIVQDALTIKKRNNFAFIRLNRRKNSSTYRRNGRMV